MAGPFDSAWLKWGWAIRHAQALQADIHAAAVNGEIQPLFGSKTEYDARRHAVLMILESVEPFPARWGLALGDIANNYRAALDHLAWALVMRGSTSLPKSEWNGIYFPIAGTKPDFEAAFRGKGKLRGLRAADRAIIRRYQPYIRGKRVRPYHCLTRLPQMTREDKHRQIQPVPAAPIGGTIEFSNPRDCEVTRTHTRGRRIVLKVGAEVHRIYVRKTGPNPDLEMQANLSARPALDDPLVWLDDWLSQTGRFIMDLLREFAQAPPEILTFGIAVPEGQDPPWSN